jgi:hypothetical protein
MRCWNVHVQQAQEADTAAEDDGGTGIILRKLGRAGQAAGPKPGDLTAVRDLVQNLCSNTQPLAKCMDYLQEDLETMTKEYRWAQHTLLACSQAPVCGNGVERNPCLLPSRAIFARQPLLCRSFEDRFWSYLNISATCVSAANHNLHNLGRADSNILWPKNVVHDVTEREN